jgi:hypothetical protein
MRADQLEEITMVPDKLMIIKAIHLAMSRGDTARDEDILARIEALLRDALGQDHGVWNWRLGRRAN